LYNLVSDVAESTNLATEYPEIVATLLAAAHEFDGRLQADKREQVWLEPAAIPDALPTE
ncbi:MAG: hypothetical protein HN849_25215, partial [Victivallales bacterium]|nr:hypothetical protein [Victivallales bacterium]